jgi:hypothetical protein
MISYISINQQLPLNKFRISSIFITKCVGDVGEDIVKNKNLNENKKILIWRLSIICLC